MKPDSMQRERMAHILIEAYGLDSTSIKVHSDGTGALKETARSPSASPGAAGTPDFIWLLRMPEQLLHSRAPPATQTTRPASWSVHGVSSRWRRRNGIERLFRRLKGFCRTCSRFDKLDVMFPGSVTFALIVEFLYLR